MRKCQPPQDLNVKARQIAERQCLTYQETEYSRLLLEYKAGHTDERHGLWHLSRPELYEIVRR